ncbi:response regulator [Sphingobacterium sp. JB170]|uniref:response regulator n=1 Tax=Sphingobacterium sp. JB170 TaxID=1434842 RepID=UPI00097EC0B7|nr:response regulator [Sphingobacterium sp. JB170]SJN32642.1 Sensor histidine kinase [Sphingobacterium sp. JB170]
MKLKNESILKWELFIGVIIAYLFIIGTTIYFFNNVSTELKKLEFERQRFHKIEHAVDVIDADIFTGIQTKTSYLLNHSQVDLTALTRLSAQIQQSFTNLKANIDSNSSLLSDLQSLQHITEESLRVDSVQNTDLQQTQNKILRERSEINKSFLSLQTSITRERNNMTTDVTQQIARLKMRCFIFVALPLLIFLYIYNRIIRAVRELTKRAKETSKLNIDIQRTKKDIESFNWVLAESSKLNEEIQGVDKETKIGEVAFATVKQSLDFYAGILYIRKFDSDTYHLEQQIGVDHAIAIPQTFNEGEGLMGNVTKTQITKIIGRDENPPLHSSSALLKNQINTYFLAPLVYENYTFGFLEIGGDYPQADHSRILAYIERISRTIAMSIKFGQSHTLVETLLEETQQQTSELEAQQEELRITNEELLHKTNLLEASEEELRVQQEELQQANTELTTKAKLLEKSNEELSVSQHQVNQKIREVEQASKYKSEFMANMSHELRTPLNSILILAKLLQDNKGKNLNTDQVKYAAVIHDAGSDLLELINDVLDLAKIEAGKIELNYETININTFTETLANLFTVSAQQKGIEFTVNVDNQVPTFFISDETRIEQVLKNFLSNALKFTNKNGHVGLEISADNDHFKFTVIDDGKGISEEKQQLIFDAFRQEDGSTSRKYGGTGLGLSISKEIASLLGGRIILESEPTKGSSFTLLIPYKQTPQVEQDPNIVSFDSKKASLASETDGTQNPISEHVANLEAAETGNHLLIVEDDLTFALILRDFAEGRGFQVMLAHDGTDAIQKALQFKPDAIILDVMLPTTDGWEVLKTLKADMQTKHIPIHMMSAANYNQREFIEHGAIGFISKPVSESSLNSAFKNINLNISKNIKKVLLVEDEEFQSEIIKSAFAERQINVLQAFTGQHALSQLAIEENIDCIILDVKLPDSDGIEILDKIKENPKYRETPIIINTAYDLSKKQIDHIRQYTKAMVLKSEKSTNRLIDEVTLFLNKLSTDGYSTSNSRPHLSNIKNQPDSLKGKKVLIADDDMRNIFALTNTLQELEMDVEIANNGFEAVDIANRDPKNIDIVLMDIMMPQMDGFEAIAKIRANKKNSNLPIIAVTAKAMKGDREKTIQSGANDYISKPIDVDKLVSLLRVWLS